MLTTHLNEPITPVEPQLDTPQGRIDAALRLLTLHDGNDVDTLSLALLTVLDPPSGLLGTDALPGSPPPAVLQQRMADHLASCWPRLAHAEFAADLASDAMTVVAPVIDQLQRAARSWRQRTVATVIERDQARDLAVTLEQANAEAVRLLRSGLPVAALSVLEGDGQPPVPTVSASHIDSER